jgi:hypothetical protein
VFIPTVPIRLRNSGEFDRRSNFFVLGTATAAKAETDDNETYLQDEIV